jgi:hypothetical protein
VFRINFHLIDCQNNLGVVESIIFVLSPAVQTDDGVVQSVGEVVGGGLAFVHRLFNKNG